jgi:hypothetical protein
LLGSGSPASTFPWIAASRFLPGEACCLLPLFGSGAALGRVRRTTLLGFIILSLVPQSY